MAGRPRRHESDIERARAYRHRRQVVIDAALKLASAVHAAAATGDSLAVSVDRDEAAATLEALTQHFESLARDASVT